MPVFIALLRGINVSGQKRIKMSDLKLHLMKRGIAKVETYIQSGNLVITHSDLDSGQIGNRIRSVIQESYGFDVSVWVRERDHFIRIVQSNFTEAADV